MERSPAEPVDDLRLHFSISYIHFECRSQFVEKEGKAWAVES